MEKKAMNKDKLNVALLEKNLYDLAARWISARYINGAVMMVNQFGENVVRLEVGEQRNASGIPVTANTMFRLASLTKPVTAIGALIAEERGLLDLDDDVSLYLPQFRQMQIGRLQQGRPVADRAPVGPVKLCCFLSHCSGFMAEDELGNLQYSAVPAFAFRSIDAMTDYCMENTFLSFEPASQAVYSTIAFDIVARIIQERSGMSYADFLTKYLFAPLGLNDLTFQPTQEQWARMSEIGNSAEGYSYVPQDMGFHTYEGYPLSYTCAGASLCGTPEAYNVLAEMLYNFGVFRGVRILSEASVRKMSQLVCGSWGLGVAVRDGTSSLPAGAYGWSGAYGTHFWIDVKNGITALMFKNHRNVAGNFWTDSIDSFERTVMSALKT